MTGCRGRYSDICRDRRAGQQPKQRGDPEPKGQFEPRLAVAQVRSGDLSDPVDPVVQRGAMYVQQLRGGTGVAAGPQIGIERADQLAAVGGDELTQSRV